MSRTEAAAIADPDLPDLEVARDVLATEAAGLRTLAAGLGPECGIL